MKCCFVGVTSTHSCVYAKLITPDGVDHGLHVFVVPIRNPKDFLPYKGVIVGDMGDKVGANGMDNGFAMFQQYRIPRENLLNRSADVTPEGKYVSNRKSQSSGASFGVLSAGRVSIMQMGISYLIQALTIATRYSAVRRQFSRESDTIETAIIEYPTQQWRLFPYLAGCYVFQAQSEFLSETMMNFQISSLTGEAEYDMAAMGVEIHGISSSGKPIVGWWARDAIQECREACGGHGYLKAARLGDLRNDNDANCTYEGENTVLIQQTSNWLVKIWGQLVEKKGDPCKTPLNSIYFLREADGILGSRFNCSTIEDVLRPESKYQPYPN